MPTIYIKKELYDEIIKKGEEPNKFINQAVEKELKKEEKQGGK